MVPVPYTKPSITQLEIEYANDAVANGWGPKCYEYINRFEKALASHLGVDYVVATSSCTGALHMGLAALGIAPGDEVIVADTNWIATIAPILHLGAKPVFVDVREDSWCIDPGLAEAAITSRTKAIIATHIYGNLCDMDALMDIGRRHSLAIIEDAAEAIGSVYHDQPAGSMGTFGVFSFHGTKTITTGEGGAFVTNNAELFERVLTLNNHGRSRQSDRQFWSDLVGYKYKMSNVEAAIGCAQLARIQELVDKKRFILQTYKSLLKPYREILLNPEPSHSAHGAWMPTAVFDASTGVTRENLLAAFQEQVIDARVFFWPVSSMPMFSEAPTPVAHSLAGRSINLPSFHDISLEDMTRVSTTLVRVLQAAVRKV